MVDNCVMAGIVVLGGEVTMVEVVVDEGRGMDHVLAERTVNVEAEDGGRVVAPEVGGGDLVVTIWMAGVRFSMAVTRAEMVETDVWMSSMDEWTDVTIQRMVARSMVASGASVCSPVVVDEARGMDHVLAKRAVDVEAED
ncbi:hypothetical protein CBR_g29755 [Chara braunii]|uniref:Uncharacterized protein n=1 Tax=Chara braunii TaxID=69332 RepID=A0A388LBA3_CHABU|nr:hypothetical protein CBR_g29755 [Chara braunii]|eukprot:GBG79607.1 hypothetical protein CBR_g29755 [Chara braunii]